MILRVHKLFFTNFILSLLYFSLPSNTFAQQYNSEEEIRKFADYLFCDKDYLRSIDEYRKLPDTDLSLIYQRKIGIAFMKMEQYDSALAQIEKINLSVTDQVIREEISLLKLKINFLQRKYAAVDSFNFVAGDDSISQSILQLKYFSSMINFRDNISQPDFNDEQKPNVQMLVERRKNIHFKSPAVAAMLSVIPGLGKIYTEEYGDGIYALLFNGIFAFLAYDNFKANHTTRAWIFSAVTLGYYGGNIYGSAASAQIYNARVKSNFETDVDEFLIKENYFVPPNLEFQCKK